MQDRVLDFNSTNVADLIACWQVSYSCFADNATSPEVAQYNATTESVPTMDYSLMIDPLTNGSLSIPTITSIEDIDIGRSELCGSTPTATLNLTGLDMPDLVKTSIFRVDSADKIESLQVSNLANVSSSLHIGLSGGPAIKFILSPSL